MQLQLNFTYNTRSHAPLPSPDSDGPLDQRPAERPAVPGVRPKGEERRPLYHVVVVVVVVVVVTDR